MTVFQVDEVQVDYTQAIDLLLALVDHERSVPALPRQKRIYDLGRMESLLARLGNPLSTTFCSPCHLL